MAKTKVVEEHHPEVNQEIEKAPEIPAVEEQHPELAKVTIVIVKDSDRLKEGEEYSVSGNVANSLIKNGFAKTKK